MPATDRLFLLQGLLKDAPMLACIKVSSRYIAEWKEPLLDLESVLRKEGT